MFIYIYVARNQLRNTWYEVVLMFSPPYSLHAIKKKGIKKGNVEFNSDIFLRIKKSLCGVADEYVYCQSIQGIIKAGGSGKMEPGISNPFPH